MNIHQSLASTVFALLAAASISACAGTTPSADPSAAPAARTGVYAHQAGVNAKAVGPATEQLDVPRVKWRELQQVEVPKIRLRAAEQVEVPKIRFRELQQVEVPRTRF